MGFHLQGGHGRGNNRRVARGRVCGARSETDARGRLRGDSQRGKDIAGQVLRIGEGKSVPTIGFCHARELSHAPGNWKRAEPELGGQCFERWWLMALTTAFKPADEIDLSMPTPHRTARWPSVSSTYAAALASCPALRACSA